MNRIIKFRAFISDLGKMYEVVNIHSQFKDEDFIRVFINKPIETEEEIKNYRIDGKKNHLMQFTGIKDKNGKEIWEGDLIKFSFNGEEFPPEEVYFKNGAFYSAADPLAICAVEDGKLVDFELLGNIYENSELLK